RRVAVGRQNRLTSPGPYHWYPQWTVGHCSSRLASLLKSSFGARNASPPAAPSSPDGRPGIPPGSLGIPPGIPPGIAPPVRGRAPPLAPLRLFFGDLVALRR